MKEMFDYCTTPIDFKNLADTIAGYLGYERDSERQSNNLYKRQFLAIESITCGIGWKLVIVHKNDVTEDLYPNIGELDYDAFRAFLKGLVIGFAFDYVDLIKKIEDEELNEEDEELGEDDIEW